jgi:arylsulfate sulfotransferase
MPYKITRSLLVLLILAASCKKENSAAPSGNVQISNEKITLNPNGDCPLTATISLTTSPKTKIALRLEGKNGTESDVVQQFTDLDTTHAIPVLGLYADYNNKVDLTFSDASGNVLETKSYNIQTAALPANIFPAISIDTKMQGMEAGMTFVSYYGNLSTSASPQFPFVFDAFGDIRWYCDFRNTPPLENLFYDVGMERLQNGDLYFGDISSDAIYEMDMQGKIMNTWALPGYQFHHKVQEEPDGNFLVTATKTGNSTVEDQILEIGRTTNTIINSWDLLQSLQYSRQTLTTDPVDWIHVNAVIPDPSDSTIIISGRTQALVKLDRHNNVVWIMGCHKGWGSSGNGANLNNYLLQPLDASGNPIADTSVLMGYTNATDFEWNWYQHAPKIMPNGDIILFDNGGDNRNFSGSGEYSRGVEFRINKANKTVQQIWEYGKERGAETFSHIVSDVDYFPDLNHFIFSPGAVDNSTDYGKVIELDYATKNVIFEATITPPLAYYGITFHRTERMSLYP